mmetsp:Transcript_60387/g.95711  ORF Transcript_60387/g.95711 Transcript_60387/m.95711 type:complete len:296 (-) Transcript_60387:309-1196(-)
MAHHDLFNHAGRSSILLLNLEEPIESGFGIPRGGGIVRGCAQQNSVSRSQGHHLVLLETPDSNFATVHPNTILREGQQQETSFSISDGEMVSADELQALILHRPLQELLLMSSPNDPRLVPESHGPQAALSHGEILGAAAADLQKHRWSLQLGFGTLLGSATWRWQDTPWLRAKALDLCGRLETFLLTVQCRHASVRPPGLSGRHRSCRAGHFVWLVKPMHLKHQHSSLCASILLHDNQHLSLLKPPCKARNQFLLVDVDCNACPSLQHRKAQHFRLCMQLQQTMQTLWIIRGLS